VVLSKSNTVIIGEEFLFVNTTYPVVTHANASAFEHFNEHRNTLKMTTGSASLDSLIDSIQQGQLYLFMERVRQSLMD